VRQPWPGRAGLGDLYFASSDYKNATLFEQKILAVDPKNEKALIAVGAAQFNLGNKAEAKKQWLIAAGLYPKNVEVHYDLGFYYMSQKPPETANMKVEWGKVVAIDPNSALAKSVQTVITGTKPTASATPSAK
jgi:Tfp pilus assembly protein PilF